MFALIRRLGIRFLFPMIWREFRFQHGASSIYKTSDKFYKNYFVESKMALLIIAIKRKRLQILMGLLSQLTIVSQSREVHRSCRRLTRNNGWWELIWKSYTDDQFKQTFRVSKDTFTFILGRIRQSGAKNSE